MKILATQYTLTTKAFEIYTAGCAGNPHCKGCHNPESWSFDIGENYTSQYFETIKTKINRFSNLIENIMIFGGEPFDNPSEDIINLLKNLQEFDLPIWVFTRYSLEEVKEKIGEEIQLIDFLKSGRYIPELACENNIQYGITLATSNQKILKKGVDY